MTIVEDVLSGDRLSLARLLTRVERLDPGGMEDLDSLFAHAGNAHIIGVTGAPGTGKSSLVNRLALAYRHPKNGKEPRRVAIVAVDPSSPFTGGALLGDRVRMRDLTGDPGIFIRSMASRGALGGLARTTSAFTQVLDAAGYEVILIETVGVGQSEIDIAKLAHTTLVVEIPGMGDDIQTAKAGILEIADILVVNKADHPGAENTVKALRLMLEMAYAEQPGSSKSLQGEMEFSGKKESAVWIPPLAQTIATIGQGVESLVDQIHFHREYLKTTGGWKNRERIRLKSELDDLLKIALFTNLHNQMPGGTYESVVDMICSRRISPYQAVTYLLKLNGFKTPMS
jgi:LAO/AO transport system kinase